MRVASRTWKYPVASEFALKTQQPQAEGKRLASDQKRAPELLQQQRQQQKGGGKRQKGNKGNDTYGGSSPSYTVVPARGNPEAAPAGLQRQEQARDARNARMNRVADNT